MDAEIAAALFIWSGFILCYVAGYMHGYIKRSLERRNNDGC